LRCRRARSARIDTPADLSPLAERSARGSRLARDRDGGETEEREGEGRARGAARRGAQFSTGYLTDRDELSSNSRDAERSGSPTATAGWYLARPVSLVFFCSHRETSENSAEDGVTRSLAIFSGSL